MEKMKQAEAAHAAKHEANNKFDQVGSRSFRDSHLASRYSVLPDVIQGQGNPEKISRLDDCQEQQDSPSRTRPPEEL